MTLTMTRADDRTLRGVLTNPATRQPLNLTGAHIWFTVKRKLTDSDPACVFRKSTVSGIDGIVVPVPASGIFFIVITAANTNFLELVQLIELEYDVQLKMSGGPVQTVARGKFLIEGEVTQSQVTA
jgi:hypothetical protein